MGIILAYSMAMPSRLTSLEPELLLNRNVYYTAFSMPVTGLLDFLLNRNGYYTAFSMPVPSHLTSLRKHES